jgi:membrane protease YdiL (CAAX protease family)
VTTNRLATVDLETAPTGRPIRQYSAGGIAAVWAAAALPMAMLAWVGAPWLAGRLDGAAALPRALIALLTVGLIWQFVLVGVLVYREQRSLRWPVIRDALWLRPPRNPKTGRRGGRTWWVVLPFIALFGLEELLPSLPHPASHDLGAFLDSPLGQHFFAGNWMWLGTVAILALFNTVLGEELLFRGLLLPRMSGVFGRWDWLANGVLFAAYHLHMPWVIPTALVDTVAIAYPSKRYRSALVGIAVHSAQSVIILVAVTALVLR